MKKKSTSQSAFFNLRVLIGLFVVLAGVFLALFATANPSIGGLGFGAFSNALARAEGTKPDPNAAQGRRLNAGLHVIGDNFWAQTNGPRGGDVITSATNASGHVFVGTQGGGVFRSADNGETWTGINNGLTDTNVRALAINSTGHIFGGTWSSGVFRSTDNGDSWTAVNNGLDSPSVRSLAIDSGGDIFAGTFYGGVYRSTDDGEN